MIVPRSGYPETAWVYVAFLTSARFAVVLTFSFHAFGVCTSILLLTSVEGSEACTKKSATMSPRGTHDTLGEYTHTVLLLAYLPMSTHDIVRELNRLAQGKRNIYMLMYRACGEPTLRLYNNRFGLVHWTCGGSAERCM